MSFMAIRPFSRDILSQASSASIHMARVCTGLNFRHGQDSSIGLCEVLQQHSYPGLTPPNRLTIRLTTLQRDHLWLVGGNATNVTTSTTRNWHLKDVQYAITPVVGIAELVVVEPNDMERQKAFLPALGKVSLYSSNYCHYRHERLDNLD
ncbi:hypothetical protein HRR83_000252 [Exophiala dermatitidis]|uniref:Uncharacterized protein n=1 Tax=Exophiala dermatitidis TaxID=5970 RepID=A0AAN6F3T5_EXODE|nr:hypothetical protein HRR73_002788 [Exophiala dermatitidis]KAJ4527499.1 hypothetical protein HRR74_000253 [Exophiala dermatitidis]KAJ4531073.1 hypothetical protein HRR76_008750 [Exophiala dermatitidis]KAJ4558238.1 hypothetical protein HRR77_000252 [Exophiala dermatitidis]KAJ4581724.1 hypothetical protein HRR79_000741 [Exophiala dermatitidis]